MNDLTEYCHHKADCALFQCATCRAYRADENHYVGTPDSHRFIQQVICTCGLDFQIQLFHAMRQHIHDLAVEAAKE
jgi:hypothetical protein